MFRTLLLLLFSAQCVRPMSHVTPAILSRDFVAQLYRATKLQHATVMSHTATLSHKQALTKLIGHFWFVRQSRSVRHNSCMLQLCRATKSRDKIAGVTSV